MNIFYLSDDPFEAARWLIDSHVIKMPVEASQLLFNCYTEEELKDAPRTTTGTVRKRTHYNHPCAIWVREDRTAFNWLLLHALELCKEYRHRYEREHGIERAVLWIDERVGGVSETPKVAHSRVPLSMPWHYQTLDEPIQSYRAYYVGEKRFNTSRRRMDFYTNRERPFWFPGTP